MRRPFWLSLFPVIIGVSLLAGCGGQQSATSRTVNPEQSSTANEFLYAANSGSNTISVSRVDTVSGQLSAVPGSPFPAAGGPLVIATTSSGKFLFASGADHQVAAYAINASTGALTPTGTPLPGPWRPSDMAVHPTERFVYVSDRFAGPPEAITPGSISAYAVDPTTGALTAVPGSPFLLQFYAQSVTIEPSGKFLYVSDNGLRAIQGFAIDSSTGGLTPLAGSPYAVPSTVNPIAATVDPLGRFLFVIDAAHNLPTDPSNAIVVFAINSGTGALVPVTGSPFSASSNEALAGVVVEPTGKHVYVSNAASISSYAIDAAGGLTMAMPWGAPKSAPQVNMVIDPAGKFMYVGSPWGSFLSAYSIDSATGSLTALSGTPYTTSTGNDWIALATTH